jgi:hypothetical protein
MPPSTKVSSSTSVRSTSLGRQRGLSRFARPVEAIAMVMAPIANR